MCQETISHARKYLLPLLMVVGVQGTNAMDTLRYFCQTSLWMTFSFPKPFLLQLFIIFIYPLGGHRGFSVSHPGHIQKFPSTAVKEVSPKAIICKNPHKGQDQISESFKLSSFHSYHKLLPKVH